jgi:hypothetical protein
MRDIGPALGLEPGASADACIEAIEALKARVDAAPAAGARHAVGTLVAIGRISAGEMSVDDGEPLPFDPSNPPAGFTGFVEGVHYRRVA